MFSYRQPNLGAEPPDLGLGEPAHRARRKVPQPEVFDPHSFEADDLVAENAKQAPDVPLLALPNGEGIAVAIERSNPRRRGDSVVEANAGPDFGEIPRGWGPVELDLVLLLHLVAGVSQSLGEVAVVGQDQQSFRVQVQPADGKDAMCSHVGWQKVQYRASPALVSNGGDDASRFVHEEIHGRRWSLNRAAPNCHSIEIRPDQMGSIRRGSAVDRNFAGDDSLDEPAARPDAAPLEKFQ